MGYCAGWGRQGHSVEQALTTVYLIGCAQCGGLECGDAGELLPLCPACLRRLGQDEDAPVYAVMEEEG